MHVFPASASVHQAQPGTPGGQKRVTVVIDGCESSCWCWESNPGPLGEQRMPSLRSQHDFLKYQMVIY